MNNKDVKFILENYSGVMNSLKNFFEQLLTNKHSAEDIKILKKMMDDFFDGKTNSDDTKEALLKWAETIESESDKEAAIKLINSTFEDFEKYKNKEAFTELRELLSGIETDDSERERLNKFLDQAENIKENKPEIISVDESVYKHFLYAAEEMGLEFKAYELKGVPKKLIMYGGKDKEVIETLLTSARVRINDLQILTKKELDIVQSQREGKEAKQVKYDGLTAEQAEKAVEYSKKIKDFILVKEEESDGKYSIYGTSSNRELANKAIFQAIASTTTNIGQVENKRLKHLLNEKAEIDEAMLKSDGVMKEAYVFSTNIPGNYIKINDTSFEYFKDGQSKFYDRFKNEEGYADILKFRINNLADDVTYMTAEEVKEAGGIGSPELVKEIKGHIFGTKIEPDLAKQINVERNFNDWMTKYSQSHDFAGKFDVLNDSHLNNYLKYVEKQNKDNPEVAVDIEKTIRSAWNNYKKQVDDGLSKITMEEVSVELPFDIEFGIDEKRMAKDEFELENNIKAGFQKE